MKVRTFKQLHQDMRDDRDIYPKRGSSLEEICVSNLMDVVHHFDSIKSEIKCSISWDNRDSREKLDFFENKMHQKFDIIEELLKECNIEQYERDYKKEIDEKYNNKR